MKNEGRGIDFQTDFKRIYVRVTETSEKTRILIKIPEPTELYPDKKTLIYAEEPKYLDGYVNLHMHLLRPEDDKLPLVKNVWVLEDTRDARYINDIVGYERWGHYKPVRYDPETMSGKKHILERFFATTYLRCQRDNKYKIPKEFLQAYADSKGDLEYAMVQPFYSLNPPIVPGGEVWTSTDYKKDVDGYIAIFPAMAYNQSMLESQAY